MTRPRVVQFDSMFERNDQLVPPRRKSIPTNEPPEPIGSCSICEAPGYFTEVDGRRYCARHYPLFQRLEEWP